jgi:hypothetical protein
MDRYLSKMIAERASPGRSARWQLLKCGKPARFSGEPAG